MVGSLLLKWRLSGRYPFSSKDDQRDWGGGGVIYRARKCLSFPGGGGTTHPTGVTRCLVKTSRGGRGGGNLTACVQSAESV